MILLLILSSVMFAGLAMFTLFSESATTVTFCCALLMLFFSVLSGFKFAEVYAEVQIVKCVLKNPSLYGKCEVEIVNNEVRYMKKHRLYFFGLGVGRLREVNIVNIDGREFLEVSNDN